jgi:hypothetical protein
MSVRLRGRAASPAAASSSSGEDQRRRLAHRQYGAVGAEVSQGLHDVVDVLVEPERTVAAWDVPVVVPVEDVHVVVGQQGPDRGPSSVAKCPEIGPTTSVRGWSPTEGLSNCSRVANGVDRTGEPPLPLVRGV